MRSEAAMLALILDTAKQDDRVRAVYMNGSRANPLVKPDVYRDFDIVFVVTETRWYLDHPDWIHVFGKTALVQESFLDTCGFGEVYDFEREYMWLMLFEDGNRIDLHIQTVEAAREEYGSDTLTVPLLDKDGILPSIPASNDSGYHVAKPSPERFGGAVNEFWWCLNNVSKGIVRRQLPYAKWEFERSVRDALDDMVNWYIAMGRGFAMTPGKHGKYYQDYLPATLYDRYVRTYADGDYAHLWAAVDTACGLFGELARAVAAELGYTYREDEETGIRAYLEQMKRAEAGDADLH